MSIQKYSFVFLEEEYADHIVKWNEGCNQDFLTQWAGRAFTCPITVSAIMEDTKVCDSVFQIMYQEKMIGTIALISVDESTGSAYMGHFLLDPREKGKGHGTAILKEFVSYCFGILRLQEMTLRVFSYNKSAVKCYQSNGFQIEERFTPEGGQEVLFMRLMKTKVISTFSTQIEICDEKPEDYTATERMTQHAFWNLHHPGCDEHLLVAKLRTCKEYVPELSKIAKINGEVVGAIFYSLAFVLSPDGSKTFVLTFGPLCVEPAYQSLGIGGKLLEVTMKDCQKAGYKAIIIFGEPGYYPRHGFVTCDHFGITSSEGTNSDPFMGIELIPGGLEGITGKFYEPEVFDNLPQEDVLKMDLKFPKLKKYHLPTQWNN